VKARHRPQRSCVACRETAEQRELVRLVYGEQGLAVDERRRAPGRGAYLCRRPACWQRARETSTAKGGGPLGHALRATLTDADRGTLAVYARTLEPAGDATTAHEHAATAAAHTAKRDAGGSGAA